MKSETKKCKYCDRSIPRFVESRCMRSVAQLERKVCNSKYCIAKNQKRKPKCKKNLTPTYFAFGSN